MIFAIRTTSGQERAVAEVLTSKAALKKLPIFSVMFTEAIKGYVFVEAPGPHTVDEAMAGIKHARTKTKGAIQLSSIERFIKVRPTIDELSDSDMVEVIAGPFRGLKARITHMDKVKGEVTIELLEEGFATLPITVHADYLRRISKGTGEEVGRKENG
ncbi:MAG: transcription elongation factor Spt5 [Candidatus Bathyarchaeia archaeon]|nr:transcription elongation factor Spt5 [Candidatus Bathyarchaeota archaeon]